MFTGLVEEVGTVGSIERADDNSARLHILADKVTSDLAPGASVAVNGVCLTAVEPTATGFGADMMAETLAKSALGELGPGDALNLERAVAVGQRLGGHIVQGHVDGVGTLLSRAPSQHWEVLRFTLPDQLRAYLVPKGSIAVSGVSLTVVEVGGDNGGHWFSVSLIPTTLSETILGSLEVGAAVNLEADVIAKYVESLLAGRSS